MRQILVAKTKLVKDISFNTARLSLGEPTTLKPGLNIVHVPLDIKPLYEATINFKFELAEPLAHNGIMLSGAYYRSDAGDVKAMLYNLTQGELYLGADDLVLIAAAYESLMLRQIEAPEAPAVEPPTRSRSRKKNK